MNCYDCTAHGNPTAAVATFDDDHDIELGAEEA